MRIEYRNPRIILPIAMQRQICEWTENRFFRYSSCNSMRYKITMEVVEMAENSTSNIGFEKQIWDAACVLRGNIDASEYKSVVLGLIFLKYISDRFETKHQELVDEGAGFEEDQDEYAAENIFFVPENARWSVIAAAAHTPEIGTVIDDAMRSIEKENKRLKDILPKNFARPELDKRRLGEVVDLLKHSIKSEGVINLFSDVQTEFSLFDPKFLEEVANMKEKNLAVELLKKLISEQVSVYRRTNIVKSEKFSEIIQSAMNRYLNGMLTNEEVIQELLKLAKDIASAAAEGESLGLTADELAFYDALTKPQAVKDFYEHDELIAITKELADLLRKNRTIDWQKKESARAGMRRLVKRLLKKYKYPPEGMNDAVQTVMSQCEMWADNVMIA